MKLYFIFCHGNGNLLKRINQVRKKIQNYFSKQKPIRGAVTGNQKEDCAVEIVTNHALIGTFA